MDEDSSKPSTATAKDPPKPSREAWREACERIANTPFRYNVLHDLESLWWITAYFVICGTVRVFPPPGTTCAVDSYDSQPWYEEEALRLQGQRRLVDDLFITRGGRVRAMTGRGFLSYLYLFLLR